MSVSHSPMDILRILPKTNCRECAERTCLAFASAVFRGSRTIDQCPHLDPAIVARLSGEIVGRNAEEEDIRSFLEQARGRLRKVDLAASAGRLGGSFDGSRLVLKILGKDFCIYPDGQLSSQIHMNQWVVATVLDYVLNSRGITPTGTWVQYRDLEGGPERLALFEQRCIKPLKKAADRYPDLFKDMLEIFSGNREYNLFGSDISIVLHPLPKVPMLICYWQPEDGMASELSLFFDQTVDGNLGAVSLFTVGAGLANMFEKIARSHGV